MNEEPEPSVESALVELVPGIALVFGRTPEGLTLAPFSLISSDERQAIAAAVASGSSVLNVGAQLANGLAQAQGLVRLAPETLKALNDGASFVKSGGQFLGTLSKGGRFTDSVRFLPATAAQTAGVVASLGPALAMIAIQVQLHEVSGLVRENLALTDTLLKAVRFEQWAELTGLEQAVTAALAEANAVGQVTSPIWENVAGYEAALLKQRHLFRRLVESHASELSNRKTHNQRRQYLEKSGEAILLDLHSLMLAHKAWFEYQALRAGRAKLNAAHDPHEATLLKTIIGNAQSEYEATVAQTLATLDVLHREISILAELPGKRTIVFTEARRSAKDVARMAEQLLVAVNRLSPSTKTFPEALSRPALLLIDNETLLDQDLRILRWHLDRDEELEAIATAREAHAGAALESFGAAIRGVGTAIPQGVNSIRKAIIEPGTEVLIAATSRRVLVAELAELRQHGTVARSISNDEIRLVRFRPRSSEGRAEIDLITNDRDESWRFPRRAGGADSIERIAALLVQRSGWEKAQQAALAVSPHGVDAAPDSEL
jgi:phosphoribosyl-ATP pyrophosphohydrolase